MPLRLNLGAGASPMEGYENLDRATGQEVYPLPYADGSASLVRASHVLEHFGHRETMDVLREWTRVLAPGGWLRVAVPDFDRIIECYESGQQYPIEGWLMGGHVDANDHHGAIFAEEPLAEALQIAGLVEVRRWESDAPDCSSLPISLNLEGRKPLPGEDFRPAPPEPARPTSPMGERPQPGAIQAVMTLPRLAFTDNMFSALQALVPLGIGLERSSGVFWGQCLTQLIERKLAANARYVLTLDYDTVFTAADVLELYRLLETRPEIDAVCGFQWRRDKTSPLFTMERADSTEAREISIPFDHLKAEAMRLRTGHFGLTMFRASAFADVERPWFHSVPGTEGRWDDKRMDEDIAFWHRWAQAGKTLYQANRCTVGHLQLVVTWPGRMMTAVHQFVPDWNAHGKPAEAWR